MAETDFFKAMLKFCTNKIIACFRLGYAKQQIAVLNNLVRTTGKIRTLKFSADFLQTCISINRSELNKIPLSRLVSFLLELFRWTQVLNRRSHELLHVVYTIRPSVLSTDGVNFKLIYCARSLQ